MPWFYNVNYAVGLGGVNARLDVLMVQYFLTKLFEAPDWADRKPRPALLVDGISAKVTPQYIAAFQMGVNASLLPARRMPADGLFHRVTNAAASDPQGVAWGLVELSREFRRQYPELFVQPAQALDAPMELRITLRRIAEEASARQASFRAAAG
jgi:hypothetical protein